MSRIGKKPIAIPAGVTVTNDNGVITVTGAKGTITRNIGTVIGCKIEGNVIHMICPEGANSDVQAKHGLYRALVANMVKGVTEGFTRNVIINGVGYKAAVQGDKLILNIGFSHPVEVEEIDGVTMECPSQTEIVISGIDKEKVGQFAAMVRGFREPEPYHGYGIRYSDEVIERKEGKAAGGKG